MSFRGDWLRSTTTDGIRPWLKERKKERKLLLDLPHFEYSILHIMMYGHNHSHYSNYSNYSTAVDSAIYNSRLILYVFVFLIAHIRILCRKKKDNQIYLLFLS